MTPTAEQGFAGGWLLSVSVVLSTAAHIAITGYFLLDDTSKKGAVDTPTMAISVNLHATEILNATESPDAPAAAEPSDAAPETAPPAEAEEHSDAPVEDTAEKQEEERQRALAEEAERKAEEEAERKREHERQLAEQRERAKQRERERQRAEERAREKKAAEAREAERKRREPARRKSEAEAERRRKQAQASSAARGSTGSRASTGRVSASQGDLRNYGASVRAKIARNASGNRGRGEAVLSFALSPSGRLVSVRIIRSSGDPSLDRSILAAVRRASPFPKPPDGATRQQLHFTIPIAVR
ncbi:MAG: cell envelope integrity protein TolA [Rhodomicrobiaceae bacterium]